MTTINCLHYAGRACAIGRNGGRCGEGFATRCRVRDAIDPAAPAVDRPAVTLPTLPARPEGATLPTPVDFPALWRELHERPAKRLADPAGERAWLRNDFAPRVPNVGCGCQSGLRTWIASLSDDDLSDDDRYFARGWEFHEAKNAELGKPGLTLDEVRRTYLPTASKSPVL